MGPRGHPKACWGATGSRVPSLMCGHIQPSCLPFPMSPYSTRGCPPAIAWGSAEHSCTSTTQQSRAAFSFFSLEAEGATRKSPCHRTEGQQSALPLRDPAGKPSPSLQSPLEAFFLSRFSVFQHFRYVAAEQKLVPTHCCVPCAQCG